ncbi:MAG: ribosome biogenesis GTPase Der [Clostridia bacterium]|nr:ribosome biogenesis GTPase Der [Clostridia bacterium]
MSKPIVAIVGRPNVGKSQLFNRITGKRISIVEDTPGVTRDRIISEAEWLSKTFLLIDTGGIEPDSTDEITAMMKRQAEAAIETADVLIFLTDVRAGVTATDREVAAMLMRSGKPIVLACNKCDTPGEPPMEFYEFYNLGLGDPIAISAIQGMGIGDLLDQVADGFPKDNETEEEDDVLKIAVIGKPNAGKSSLINRLLGEERLIVSNVPGTTRDAIDTYVEKDGQKYLFIDTAGIRKKSKVYESVEKYSVLRSYAAIERADICLIMLDGTEGVTEQDTKIAGYAHNEGKASIFVVNKWDIIDKDDKTMDRMKLEIKEGFSYMMYAPALFISAKTGQRIDTIFPMLKTVNENRNRRVTTGMLNDLIADATARVQPPTDKGRRLKILYAVQSAANPPQFVIFVNDTRLMHFSYERYLENQLRNSFDFTGTPIKFYIRERNEKKKL